MSRFNDIIKRRNTNSVKWNSDFLAQKYGDGDVTPMWVADMDFRAPEAVIDALSARAAHGIYGYDIRPEAYDAAIIGWMRRRHGWTVQAEWLCAVPSVVPAVNYAIQAYCRPGDKVLLQSPVYYPFFHAIENNGCEVADNTLMYENDTFGIDFADFERKASDPRVKLFLLCSPHNPASRVWTKRELETMGRICAANGVVVAADEIHHDLVIGDKRHTVFASISDAFAENSLTFTAPSKTFNLAGLYASSTIIPSEKLRAQYQDVLKRNAVEMTNTFSIKATRAAYDEGEPWLDELLVYLKDSADFIGDFVARRMPKATLVPIEATYLAFIDVRAYSLDDAQTFFAQHAKVGLHGGEVFGEAGRGFVRLNFACPRSVLKSVLVRMAMALGEA